MARCAPPPRDPPPPSPPPSSPPPSRPPTLPGPALSYLNCIGSKKGRALEWEKRSADNPSKGRRLSDGGATATDSTNITITGSVYLCSFDSEGPLCSQCKEGSVRGGASETNAR